METSHPGHAAHRLQWPFAAFAVLNLGLLLTGSDFAVIRTMALAGYGVAVLLSVVAGLRWHRGGRRLAIGLHLALAPLQFLFSIPDTLALAGMAFSVTILALSKPRFPRLAPRTRKVWLILHIGVSAGWLGVALTMTALAITGSVASSHSVRHGAYELLEIVDLAAAIPSMALSIITGLVISLGTKWGLVRWWWVITKFAISLTIPVLAGSLESSLADELALRTADPGGRPGGAGIALTACLAGFTVALWAATILSVLKPWPRTRWGRAADERERAIRPRSASRETAPRVEADTFSPGSVVQE